MNVKKKVMLILGELWRISKDVHLGICPQPSLIGVVGPPISQRRTAFLIVDEPSLSVHHPLRGISIPRGPAVYLDPFVNHLIKVRATYQVDGRPVGSLRQNNVDFHRVALL